MLYPAELRDLFQAAKIKIFTRYRTSIALFCSYCTFEPYYTMKLNILAFAAHPDDVELSCAGTLLKHIAQGYKVGVVDLTRGELGTRGSAPERDIEASNATKILGLSARANLRMPDGFFTHEEENIRAIVQIIRLFQPDIILANALNDRHPDHARAAKLVADSVFYSGLRKIETTWDDQVQAAWRPKALYHYIQDYYLNPDFVVDITPFMDKKIESIHAYKTQFFDPNSAEPVTPISTEGFMDAIKSRARDMGRPAGYDYAEGFNKSRTIGVKNLFDLD